MYGGMWMYKGSTSVLCEAERMCPCDRSNVTGHEWDVGCG